MRLTSHERDAATMILDDRISMGVVVDRFNRLAQEVGTERATHVASVAWRLRRIRNGQLVRSLGRTGSGLRPVTLAALEVPNQIVPPSN